MVLTTPTTINIVTIGISRVPVNTVRNSIEVSTIIVELLT